MKKFKVNYTTKSGRPTHRYFLAPDLLEAQAQFNAVKHIAYNCYWSQCPYIDVTYYDRLEGTVESHDLLYKDYIEKYPSKEISFIAFLEIHKR